MPTLNQLLGADHQDNNRWRFHIPTELHGAFGGAFGGIVASCTLVAARSVAPGRVPNALDCRFVRGLVAGDAIATTTVLNEGRTLSTISVDLTDEDGRLCTRATISLVNSDVLDTFEVDGPSPGDWKAHDDAPQMPALAPIVATIDPRLVSQNEHGIATSIKIPWDDDGHSAEAACMAGDMSVGAPVGLVIPPGVRPPNPDISLRFCGEVTTDIIVGLCRLDRANGGVAATSIEVYSGDALVANGVSTSLLLPAPT